MQADVVSAFLAERCERQTLIRFPPGTQPGGDKEGLGYPLVLNLYGSQEGALVFFNGFKRHHIQAMKFSTIPQEQCLFIKTWNDGTFVKVLVHVDDSIIAYKGEHRWEWYKKALGGKYEFNHSELKYFLGMNFARDANSGAMSISMEPHIDRMLRAFNITGKPTNTPVASDKGKATPTKKRSTHGRGGQESDREISLPTGGWASELSGANCTLRDFLSYSSGGPVRLRLEQEGMEVGAAHHAVSQRQESHEAHP